MTTPNLLISVVSLCLVANCGGQTQPPPPQVLFDRASSVHNNLIPVYLDLVRLAEDESASPWSRAGAIRWLAMWRPREAVRPLVKLLLFRGGLYQFGPLDSFPAAAALVAIGSEIYPEAWYSLKRECTDEYIVVLAWTFVQIDNQDKDIVLLRAKKQLADPEAEDVQKTNIMRLIKVLEATDFKNIANRPK